MKKLIFFLMLPCFLYGGEVVSVQGDVKAFLNKAWVAIKKGDKIPSGTKIMTGVKSQAEILAPSGRVTIQPMTLITYNENIDGQDSRADITLQNGSVGVKYTKPPQGKAEFRVQTPKGTASVRGTEEMVSYDAVSGMRVFVISGHVEALGRQLLQDQDLGVSQRGNIWDKVVKIQNAVGILDEVGEKDTMKRMRDRVDELLGEGLSPEDIANMLSDPQKL
ncbi:FecR family protein [Thermospira aquatica]|uniref:FecR domain-containing protein n=1 Tax=Thermospira aquatica TaxID=2828656 RepID=A0AAX3BFQ2_9SPIR|nr:FecR family protein [Thermospira aquatica]URA11247.1 FecR domain-containing protein [Thermospira aquatica]